MKKILSVALSTAMAFSMFASVAFGDTAVTPQQQFDALKAKGIFEGFPDGTAGLNQEMTRGQFAKVITKLLGLKEVTGQLSYKDKNYTAKNWAVPYIEAVTAAGIMEGTDKEKQLFSFNGKVTIAEMATILTRALDLEIPAETNNSAPAWAKGYVQAAINAGLVDANANFTANASRQLLVGAAYAVDQAQNLKVTKYEVSEGGKVVTFTISDGETVKVTLEKALEANKETEVKFTYKEKQFTEKVTYVVEAATKVQSASSTNLKEVDVAFDGKVDKATATDKANYTVDANAKGIKSITLLADGKTARLLLNESSKFTQGTTYKVVVKNVKSSTGTVLPQGEVSFTSADNTLPTVTEVKALGTKVIKVTFSEPIVAPSSSNFQLDDKAFVGSVTPGANQREVILRDYTGTISEGAHKLTTSMIEDFAGLKSLASTTDFTVAADTEGPKVTEISATLEKVTVTFDEEIDPASVTNDSFYWKNGDSKKTGTVTQIASNVYEVVFSSDNRLPGYESTLFVEVKDYSGNANAVKEHKINASVDLVRPQVVETTFGDRGNKTLTVRFDKAVNAADKKFYTVKKGNDVIPVESVTAADASGKLFYVNMFNPLASGTYNLKIADVQDTTALKNTLVEYNGTFVANDTANPSILFTDYNQANRKLTLNFGREMDLATVQAKSNYYIKFQKSGSDAANFISIPNEVTVNPVNGGKSVVLTFPENIDGTAVTFGPNGSIQEVNVTGLRSKTGQVVALNRTVLEASAANQVQWTGTKQKDAKTFELTFNKVIANANIGDFQINGKYPSSVSIDDNVVTLKASDDQNSGAAITVFANSSIETYSNTKLNLPSSTTVNVNNAVAPRVDKVESERREVSGKQVFDITFLNNVASATSFADVTADIVVRDTTLTNTPALQAGVDYAVTGISGKTVTVTLLKTDWNTKALSVKVENAKYLVAANSTVKAANSDLYTVAAPAQGAVDTVSVTGTKYTEGTAAVAAVSNTENGVKLAGKTKGQSIDSVVWTEDNTIPVGTVVATTTTIKTNNATAATVENTINSQAGLPYTVTDVTGYATPTAPVAPATSAPVGTFTFTGNSPKVNATFEATLSEAVTYPTGSATGTYKVTIGTKTYDATITTSGAPAVTKLVVDLGDDAKADIQDKNLTFDVTQGTSQKTVRYGISGL